MSEACIIISAQFRRVVDSALTLMSNWTIKSNQMNQLLNRNSNNNRNRSSSCLLYRCKIKPTMLERT